MCNFKYLKLLLSTILVAVLSCVSLYASAATNNFTGDLNGDGRLNAVDITMLRMMLINSEDYLEEADLNSDNLINLKDLVRMKKNLTGEVISGNVETIGYSWVLLNGDEDFGIVTGIGYQFYTNCHTTTVYIPSRYVWETSAYISTDIYYNPEYPQPDMEIASTMINNQVVTMNADDNIFMIPDKLIGHWISYEEFYVPYRSECKTTFSLMMKEALYPYGEITNEFTF